MLFNKSGGGNSNILLWVILLVIAVGYGKCGSALGINLFTPNPVGPIAPGGKDPYVYPPKATAVVTPVAGPGLGRFGGLLGGNAIFIILIVVALFLCKDKDQKDKGTGEIEVLDGC